MTEPSRASGALATLAEAPARLRDLALELYAGPELALRALWAPLPYQGFRSALDHRGLWRKASALDAGEADLRNRIEWQLRQPLYAPATILRSPEEPFFPAAGTSGVLRSPYLEVSNPFFWLMLMLEDGDEERTSRTFETRLPIYRGRTLLEVARASRPSFSRPHVWFRLGLGNPDWQRLAYDMKMDQGAGTLGQ